MYSAVILNSKLDYWSCLKKDSSVPFLHHNPSKLNNKRPDSDHPKAQGLDKRPQAIFVSGRISELTSATSLSVNDKKKNNILSFGGFIDIYNNHLKEDHRSYIRNLYSCEKKTWKKIKACTGFEPLTSTIPVQRSTT